MSETVKPTIAALRAWLKTCPLIADEQEATGAAFRIAGLDEEATAFSIEDSPGDPVLTKYLSGRDMAKNYLFLSRREYGEADVLAIQNSGFFDYLHYKYCYYNKMNNISKDCIKKLLFFLRRSYLFIIPTLLNLKKQKLSHKTIIYNTVTRNICHSKV